MSWGRPSPIRIFAAGFLAGAFTLALVVARYDRTVHSWLARQPAATEPAETAERPPLPDSDTPVLESATGTSGAVRPPSMSAPPAAELAERDLAMPIDGLSPDRLVRSFDDDRGGRRHEAIDIMAAKGTPVRAIEDGRIARLFISRAGGITVYQFDPTERFCYYYAHLDRYAEGLREDDMVRKGQVIGYVGTSGNAPPDTPHLHFAIFRLTAEKRWWEGTPIDPYDVLK